MTDEMPTKLPRYVFRRANGSFRYKRNVPKHLRPLIGKATLYRQLGDSYREAVQNLPLVHARIEALLNDEANKSARERSIEIIQGALGEDVAELVLAEAVPEYSPIENLLDTTLPTSGRLFPQLSVDRVVKRYDYLRTRHPELRGTVFHSTRKWFITQCERAGVPEHFTASLVGHHSARSANKLTYGLYSAGISDAQKREIVDGVRLPDWERVS